MTPAELTARTQAWRDARDRERRLRPARDTAIREAIAAGLTHRAIGVAVDVAHGLPGLILKDTPKP